ncbi:helicase/secretion neighborhood TadE-like protein [Thermomonospora echinospora]|uniref:Helicase/secretion neighborhood TadE-like protein n=1 Tax=Thermomonospora echinospora TaxID=1992 RepID=A0A1H6CES1_9ACTN|nr:helicase/secretion neighborhood TadE-like protein [Thermomonospora echinospora]
MLAFVALVWVFSVTVVSAGAVRVARHRAYGAADLAALAAASRAAEGSAVACRRAAVVAEGVGGRLSSCVVRGAVADVEVLVAVRLPAPVGRVRFVSRARAGPQALNGVS